MAEKIRWGLLSTARINDALIDPIRQAERSELMAVGSRDPERAEAYAAEKGIPKAYDSYEALLADPEIDVIYNSLPNSLHAEWTIKAAQAGKHVLCEKPLVVSAAELDQVEETAKTTGVTIFEAFMYLHHPQTRRARQLIQEGKLGELQLVDSWFNFYLAPTQAQNIRLRADVTGGALWDVGVYPNSLAITMTGGRAPAEVWAQQVVGESGVDVVMRAQLRFEGGAVAQISTGFRSPFREGAYIVGDSGILQIPKPWKPGLDGVGSQLLFSGRDGSTETMDFDPIDPYLCEVEAMEACILDGAEPIVPLSQSREFITTALAIYESARTGKVVSI